MVRFTKLLAAVTLVTVASLSAATAAESIVAGYIEPVRIYPGGLDIGAKLDTGAASSSPNVARPEPFERGGKRYLRFNVVNRMGQSQTFEREVVRTARIRRAGAEINERPVVRLGICLGGIFKWSEVNLRDRSGMDFQMLIGRSFLARSVLVDSEAQNRTRPSCTAGETGSR